MSGPLCFLVEHENTILTAYRQNNAKPRNTWISLEKDLPQLSRAMTFNTFKQYVSVFAFVKTELDKVRQEKIEFASQLDKTIRQKSKLERQVKALQDGLKTDVNPDEPNRLVRQKSNISYYWFISGISSRLL